jgi:diguanylate cyclase (GGDEF)-like protein/PAS domain S-box-containing protein
LDQTDLPPAAGFVIRSSQVDALRSTVERVLRWHQTEQALKATTERYGQAMANRAATERLARLGSWGQDPATCELEISAECLRIHGLDPHAGCPTLSALWARVHRSDHERLQALMQRAHDDGQPYDTQYLVSLPEGSERRVQIRAAVYDAQGHRRVIATVQDITEQKHAEEALRQSEARASRLLQERDFILENSRDVLYYMDQNGLIFYISPVVEQLTGYPPEAWQGDFRRHLVDSPRTRKAISETFDILRTGREYPPAILEFRKKDGGILYGEIKERPIIKDGKVSGLVGVARDVTERLQVESRLRQAAAVFENTLEAIMITGPDRQITAVNRAFADITEYTEAEVIGRNADFLAARDEPTDLRVNVWKAVHETGRWSGEMWKRRKSGEAFPAWVAASTIRDHAHNITHYVIVMSDLSRLKESEEKLDWLAHYDPLTKLPNRLLFNSRLSHAIRRAERERTLLAVMFVDLDNFKKINDTRGHPVGDRLLQEVGQRLNSCLRKEDTVARLSGDEFIVILEDVADSRFLANVAQKILASVSLPCSLDGDKAVITASIGISLFPQDGRDVTRLVQNADTAMYRAKELGPSHFQFYTPELTIHAVERMAMESALRAGLQRDEFVLYYQPQISLSTGEVVGVEALIRWQHPERGLVLPDAFIGLGEETGLIIPIGHWVLQTACRQVQAWFDAGAAPITLAVNISARQLAGDEAFVDTVAAVLAETGFSPASLQLEITESVIMHNAEEAGDIIRRLKSLGVSIAIDDFGTGYSSMMYLKRFSVDKLKTDKSFVQDIAYDANDRAITEAIIGLGHSLHVKVIAEGVESAEQQSFLREHGCDEMQGFLFSPPLQEQECMQLLKKLY